MITSEMTIARGMFFCGFFASSPVVAIQSNPTKPKKHFAAPAITPANPNGRKPPSPAVSECDGGIESLGIFQLLTSAITLEIC